MEKNARAAVEQKSTHVFISSRRSSREEEEEHINEIPVFYFFVDVNKIKKKKKSHTHG